ncbi:MAG: hypothetical protein RL591_2008, partial [Planctomycetota bacterium]
MLQSCVSQSLIGLREPRPPRPRFELFPLLVPLFVPVEFFVAGVEDVPPPVAFGFAEEVADSSEEAGAIASSSDFAATS